MIKLLKVIQFALLGLCLISLTGCLAIDGGYPTPAPAPAPGQQTGTSAGASISNAQAERLKRLMVPLLNVMDNSTPHSQVRIGVIDDPNINAGSAGNGQFIVTTGLLYKANDVHLQSILAHEVAHDDLGHAAKVQVLGAGVDLASVLLDEIFPGSGQITPIIGNLALRAYSRNEEYAADEHGVRLLRRLNLNGQGMMANTLTWLQQTTGGSSGGFFSTHPDTGDRVQKVRKM